MGLLGPCGDLLVEFIESSAQGAGELGKIGKYSAQARAQDAVIDSREEQGGAQAEVGQPVTMRAREALDKLMQPQAAQVISHLSGGEGGGGFPKESGEALPQMAVGESARQLRKRQQGVAEGLNLGIGEAERRSSLLIELAGTIDLLEGLFGQDTVVADFFDLQ